LTSSDERDVETNKAVDAESWAGEGCCRAAYESDGHAHDHATPPTRAEVEAQVRANDERLAALNASGLRFSVIPGQVTEPAERLALLDERVWLTVVRLAVLVEHLLGTMDDSARLWFERKVADEYAGHLATAEASLSEARASAAARRLLEGVNLSSVRKLSGGR
jgi:hypothetical protein